MARYKIVAMPGKYGLSSPSYEVHEKLLMTPCEEGFQSYEYWAFVEGQFENLADAEAYVECLLKLGDDRTVKTYH